MKRYVIMITAAAVAALSLTACREKVPEVPLTDKGPQMQVLSCDASAYMGGNVHFSVDLSDEGFALSTLKAEILFDETVVSSKVIRTTEYGRYDGVVPVPLLKDIPDGTAELRLTAQNVGTGVTTELKEVSVSRPNFDTIKLVTEDGDGYEMTRTSDYNYSVTAWFPARVKARLVTPVVNEHGEIIIISWDGTALSADGKTDIPFYQPSDGVYTISADLLRLTASPFGATDLVFSEGESVVTAGLCQGTRLNITGLEGWNLDPDWFDVDGTTITFKAVSGHYRLAADYRRKFLRVDQVKEDGSYYSDYNPDDGVSAVYAIGSGIGKGGISANWNTTTGAWCMAQVEEKVYRITFKAGRDINNGAEFKFFGSRGWGGEFTKASYAEVGLDRYFEMPEDNGNIKAVGLEMGKGYSLILDLTGGHGSAVLKEAEIEMPAEGLDIKLFGVNAMMIDENHYCVRSVRLEQGARLEVSGIDDILEWWMDPDFITGDYAFNAMTGYYMVDLYLDRRFATFKRLTGPNGDKATSNSGAVWMMAWGLANWRFSNDGIADGDDNQLGFSPGSSYCMAEVAPDVFQFSGYAVENTDNVTLGGRFCYDYISAKWFGQDSWGDEKGKIKGAPTEIRYTERALALLNGAAGGDNIELAEGVTLELGAFYVFRLDISVPGVESVDFYKVE